MIDTHTHRDHRREAAMATNQSNGRGYAFDRMIDESPLWIRVLAEIVRPRSLVMLAVIGFVSSLFWF